ncbi:hypothetical protein [Luteipulveratus halotolerans]|uniref:HK97 gp10 family phage protein n=1 Tax=Luteipulveratus halotolerans TaxID=1631356 RepID=A0A0L6CK39_9MICO|nr:hypothetical protein [Luteipulveratus halotolerans]KNX38099.1 hypothetical protein VV01_14645 [Luteipulveratus halotolerans]
MGFHLDMSQVRRLADDLRDAAQSIEVKAEKVVAKGALNVKTQMQQEAVAFDSGTRHRKFAADISYDQKGLNAEIGPTLDDIGSVQLFYLGNYKTGPSVPDPSRAAEREAPKLSGALLDVGADIL